MGAWLGPRYTGRRRRHTYKEGEIKGVFNPTTSTWRAVGALFEMETGAFVSKLATLTTDAQKEAFYQAARSPAPKSAGRILREQDLVRAGQSI